MLIHLTADDTWWYATMHGLRMVSLSPPAPIMPVPVGPASSNLNFLLTLRRLRHLLIYALV